MSHQKIVNHLRLISTKFVFQTSAYSINEKGKFVWLQKLCFKILSKYGTQYIDERNNFRMKIIETDKIMELVYETINNMRLHGQKCRYVIVGNKQMSELYKLEPTYCQLSASFKYGYREEIHIANCKLILCPWIDGVICLPEIL